MSDFAGKWKAAQGKGRLILCRLSPANVSDDKSDGNEDIGTAVYGGVLCDGEDTSSELLESVIEQLQISTNDAPLMNDSPSHLQRFVESSSARKAESHLTVLLGTIDVGGSGITGDFVTSDLLTRGEFAFLLQDENSFVGGLTCDPSRPTDGWWMRQNILRKILVEDPDEYDE